MTLSDIKHYLSERRQATLADIANRFDAQPEAVQGMLQHWLRKGKVSCVAAPQCSGCRQCDGAALEVYRWRE